ncbi:xaa-Pro aminopeptidase ApepP-like isoform X2 [Pecten maximus]|uniref:xaa-Pro aminopeptidase ApepP-like isoform X2 n=1 Tax=Pecten maximus TaxID=6579 RepID=UPI001458D224|nr:xaa-Pro aminopeptidase ApepP-like isoform X2 [Pecten maximus]
MLLTMDLKTSFILWVCVCSTGFAHNYGSDCVHDIPHEITFVQSRENCTLNHMTWTRLKKMQDLFSNYGLDAYIVTTQDAHHQQGGSPHDRRLEAISGFDGTIGAAVITRNKTVIWTDGRNVDAAMRMDCGWQIYRKGAKGIPSLTSWVKAELQNISRPIIGACPSLMAAVWWKNFKLSFAKNNITMLEIEDDLVDQVWEDNRPPQINVTINALPLEFAGRSWQDKMTDVHHEMAKAGVDILVVSDLDENPWLFNMRAFAFGFDPFFYSFAVIERRTRITRLYIIDHKSMLSRKPSDHEVHVTLERHLDIGEGRCSVRVTEPGYVESPDSAEECVQNPVVKVGEYNMKDVVRDITRVASLPHTRKVWLSPYCSYAIYSAVPRDKIYQDITPISVLKSTKNPVEIQGMEDANLLDSVAAIRFFARLEKEVKQGKNWTVYDAFHEIHNYRKQIPHFRAPAFRTLTGSGPTAAPIYNMPTPEDSQPITREHMFMQDSGGQYLNTGTTDMTRSFHFGNPTKVEKDIYTRVLMAHINLAELVWPEGRTGHDIDATAREPLWELGLDYSHETGHGIGAYGGVIEGPGRISSTFADFISDVPFYASIFTEDENINKFPDPTEYPLRKNMFFTVEPGYYEMDNIGVRMENVMYITPAHVNQLSSRCKFLRFETITLVPYESHLIDYNMLSHTHLDWLNEYNSRVLQKTAPILERFGDTDALAWLMKRVENVTREPLH